MLCLHCGKPVHYLNDHSTWTHATGRVRCRVGQTDAWPKLRDGLYAVVTKTWVAAFVVHDGAVVPRETAPILRRRMPWALSKARWIGVTDPDAAYLHR